MLITYNNKRYEPLAKKVTKMGTLYLILIDKNKKWVKGKEDVCSGYSNFLAR
jgi:hypothetical protein